MSITTKARASAREVAVMKMTADGPAPATGARCGDGGGDRAGGGGDGGGDPAGGGAGGAAMKRTAARRAKGEASIQQPTATPPEGLAEREASIQQPTATPPAGLTEREAARWLRWRGHVEAFLERYATNPNMIPFGLLEEAEGRPLVEVILTHLARRFKDPVEREDDEWHEAYATRRRRDIHEREAARSATFFATFRGGMGDAFVEGLVRRFYRPGDVGLHAAQIRATRYALGLEVTP